PVEPKWRAGRLSIGYVEDRDLVLLEIDELLPEDESEEEEEEEEEEAEAEAGEDEPGDVVDEDILESLEEMGVTPGALAAIEAMEELEEPTGERIRVFATREQMLSLSRQGALVAARGRPACQFCGNPIDPEGHVCP